MSRYRHLESGREFSVCDGCGRAEDGARPDLSRCMRIDPSAVAGGWRLRAFLAIEDELAELRDAAVLVQHAAQYHGSDSFGLGLLANVIEERLDRIRAGLGVDSPAERDVAGEAAAAAVLAGVNGRAEPGG